MKGTFNFKYRDILGYPNKETEVYDDVQYLKLWIENQGRYLTGYDYHPVHGVLLGLFTSTYSSVYELRLAGETSIVDVYNKIIKEPSLLEQYILSDRTNELFYDKLSYIWIISESSGDRITRFPFYSIGDALYYLLNEVNEGQIGIFEQHQFGDLM